MGSSSSRTATVRQPVATWTFEGAYPIKYTGPTLDTHSALLAFETIELTHKGLKRDT